MWELLEDAVPVVVCQTNPKPEVADVPMHSQCQLPDVNLEFVKGAVVAGRTLLNRAGAHAISSDHTADSLELTEQDGLSGDDLATGV